MPTTPLSPVLVTEHLRKCYGSHVALDDLKTVVEHEIAWEKSQKKDTDCCSVQLSFQE